MKRGSALFLVYIYANILLELFIKGIFSYRLHDLEISLLVRRGCGRSEGKERTGFFYFSRIETVILYLLNIVAVSLGCLLLLRVGQVVHGASLARSGLVGLVAGLWLLALVVVAGVAGLFHFCLSVG